MNYTTFVTQVTEVLNQCRNGTISGAECVRAIDDFMADKFPDNVPSNVRETLEELHEDFSFCVEDEAERKEHPAYYGPAELKGKAAMYYDRLKDEVHTTADF